MTDRILTHRVVALILVFGQPVSDIVVDDTGVVSESKVGVLVLGPRLLLQEGSRFSQQVLLQLVFKGLVRSLGEHSFLFKDGEETQPLNQF